MMIIKTVDYDTGYLASVTIRSPERDARDASIDVLKPAETDVRLPRGWYLFTDGRGEYTLDCRPTDADILAELTYLLAEVQDSEDEDLVL
ncbi:hypothetical protein [Allochromatium palmeri]|uniref:Uncharacterized protein n=1 Tax=Allochromatium palmeri TaxID=231048 RepID=A0A6N8EJL6_9GAMM|nr:hypothetical protein [Allochromatium palmeri]MTW23208.1 hypothetical protein [Allochromatium palmeri]